MDLERYVNDLRTQLAVAASGADDAGRAVAERLALSLDAAARLVLLEALSEAAAELTTELAPASVELRLRGRDPEFTVVRGSEPDFAEAKVEAEPEEDTGTTRTTLRLPDQLKSRVEKAAAEDGLSLNTWLVRAIASGLEPKTRRSVKRETREGDTYTGWVS